jgi:hypothetical protein
MKSVVVSTSLFLIFLLSSHASFAQTWIWTGGGGTGNRDWDSGANWLAPTGSAFLYPPNSSSTVVLFNGSASDTIVDLDFFPSIGTIRITGGGVHFRKKPDFTGVPFVAISAPTSMEFLAGFCTFSGGAFLDMQSGNAQVAGILALEDNSKLNQAGTFTIQKSMEVLSGGQIILKSPNATILTQASNRMIFRSGSALKLRSSGFSMPAADFQTGSLIDAKVTVAGTVFGLNSSTILNCDIIIDYSNATTPESSWGTFPMSRTFGGTLTVKNGAIRFKSLTSAPVNVNKVILENGEISLESAFGAVGKLNIVTDLEVRGGKFNARRSVNNNTNIVETTIGGNLIQTGGIIDICESAFGGIGRVFVGGNLNQTAGTITESGTSGALPDFNKLSFRGTTPQTANFGGTISGDKLQIDIDNSTGVTLLSNLTAPHQLQFLSGKLTLGINNLVVTDLLTGGNTSAYVVTNGIGTVTLKNVGAGVGAGALFPIGTSSISYDPIFVSNNDIAKDFTARVTPNFEQATTGLTSPLQRQWFISSASNNANLSFKPDAAAGVAPSSPRIAHFEGGTWVEQISSASAFLGFPYAANFTSFSPFVISSSGTFPVELEYVKAKNTGDKNLVSWKTATEFDLQGYEVQRSGNGFDTWEKIAEVKAQNKFGAYYEFEDNQPLALSYYRLKILENDGKIDFSKIVSVRKIGQKWVLKNLQVVNNQAIAQLEIASTEQITLKISDVTGKTWATQSVQLESGRQSISFDIQALPHGVYFLSIENTADGSARKTQKFVRF